MRNIILNTCLMATLVGSAAYAANAPGWFASKRQECVSAVGGTRAVNFYRAAVCCIYKDGGERISAEIVNSSGLGGAALCTNILGQKHKENGEVKHAGIEMDPDYADRWWYKNLTDVQPAEARIPSWWPAAGSNCQKHPKEEISGCCLFNAKGSKLKEETVKVSGANAQRGLCKEKLKATSQAEYFGLWVCKDPGDDPCRSWDWWYGDIYE